MSIVYGAIGSVIATYLVRYVDKKIKKAQK